jgi:hypothetical protein
MYRNVVVGFDAREMWLDVDSQWPQTRKDEILLRHDVVKPLSVDHYVWHSVFSESSEPRLWRSVSRQARYSGSEWEHTFAEGRKLSAPDGYRPRNVWRNLASLQGYLQESWGEVWKPCYVVAVVEVMRNELDEEEEEGGPEPISPQVVDSRWQLFGYDVADYELYSGLFNGAMDLDEAAKLRREWKNHLNEYHLFVEPQKAFDYIAAANARYPSHMPYYVYALYGVEEKRPASG